MVLVEKYILNPQPHVNYIKYSYEETLSWTLARMCHYFVNYVWEKIARIELIIEESLIKNQLEK